MQLKKVKTIDTYSRFSVLGIGWVHVCLLDFATYAHLLNGAVVSSRMCRTQNP